jgi:ankyrin repeat protein
MTKNLLMLIPLGLLLVGCGPSQREARHQMADQDIPFTEAEFAKQAGAGNRDTLQLFFDAGMELNVAKERDAFPLVQAAAGGHVEIVSLLSERGADPNIRDAGRTPLIAAVSEQDTSITDEERADVVRALLNAGANPRLKYIDKTPLLIASETGNTEVVDVLLEAGADPGKGLAVASRAGHTELMKKLREAGADVNAAHPFFYKKGEGTYTATALSKAAEGGHVDAVKQLLEAGAKPEGEGNRQVLSLSHTEPTHDKIFDLVVRAGADGPSKHALVGAACAGRMDIVRKNLERGMDPDATVLVRRASINGISPLVCAAENGRADVVDALLDAGADVNKGTGYKRNDTPLLMASENGHTEVVRLLLNAGADVSRSDVDAITALGKAAREGHYQIVKLLLEGGADVEGRAYTSGTTAIQGAKAAGHTRIVELLRSAGAGGQN